MKRLLVFFLIGGALYGASPQEALLVQEMRLALDHLRGQMHSHSVEMDLAQERAQNLENIITNLRQELKASSSDKALERRIATLEKAHETLIADFKTLKTHLNETNTSIALCQTQLGKIDKQISSDISSLKASIQSMLAILQSDAKSYTVQAGDSLGQIAINHKTDIKTLKKLNNLSSDVIYSGQKLILP